MNAFGRQPCCEEPRSRADTRRDCLIAAARMLFAQNGFHATGMAQIARASGIAMGQIYRDFANKEEIVAAIVERDLSDFLGDQRLDDRCCAGDVAAVRAWILDFLLSKQDKDPRLVAEIIAESSRNARISEIFQSIQRRLRDVLDRALTVLAPEPEKAMRRTVLAEVILTVSGGMFHRRMVEIAPAEALAVQRVLLRSIERELDALQAPLTAPPGDARAA